MPLYAITAYRSVNLFKTASTEIEASTKELAIAQAKEEQSDLVWVHVEAQPSLIHFEAKEITATEGLED
jgi:flavin-binding protein dodecin